MKRTLLASLLVLIAFAGPAAADADVIATLAAYDGTLDVVRTGIALSLFPEMPLLSGDIVHTRDGRATIRFPDRSELRLKAHTRLAINERKERRDLEVFFGRLWAFVVRQKDRETAFRTGGTIAAVRGSKGEYSADEEGNVMLGIIDGLWEVTWTSPSGETQTFLLGPGVRQSWSRQGASEQSAFKEGDIAGDGAPAGPAGPPGGEEPAEPKPEPKPEPAPAAPADAAPGEELPPTQGEYAIRLINALGISSALPPNATARDAMDFLARLGLMPCNGHWEDDKPIDLNDLLCIAGIDPNDPNAPLTISQEELIAKILEKYGELFWLQSRRKQSVSPFVP